MSVMEADKLKKLVESCFVCSSDQTGLDMSGFPTEFTFKFNNHPNPSLLLKRTKDGSKCAVMMVIGAVRHVIYEGTEAEVTRTMKRVSMETALRDESKPQDEYVWEEDEDEDI
jgi:hypothetical protein